MCKISICLDGSGGCNDCGCRHGSTCVWCVRSVVSVVVIVVAVEMSMEIEMILTLMRMAPLVSHDGCYYCYCCCDTPRHSQSAYSSSSPVHPHSQSLPSSIRISFPRTTRHTRIFLAIVFAIYFLVIFNLNHGQ